MPDADQEEGDKEGEHTDERLYSGRWQPAHQRDQQRVIDICLEPAGERDVPSAPEIDEILRGERPIKILRQDDAEEPCAANDEIRIAGEIEVEKKWIAECDDDRCAQFFSR